MWRALIFSIFAMAVVSPAQAKSFQPKPAAPVTMLEAAPAASPVLATMDEPILAAFEVDPPLVIRNGPRLQCAVYARDRAGVELRGAAGSWWAKAQGVYKRASAPDVGAVLVLGGTRFGHVAVVATVLSSREILVDHANWMNKGEVQLGALVRDVSPNNDWSQVRVWYPPTKGLGTKAYPVKGFILPGVQVQVAALN